MTHAKTTRRDLDRLARNIEHVRNGHGPLTANGFNVAARSLRDWTNGAAVCFVKASAGYYAGDHVKACVYVEEAYYHIAAARRAITRSMPQLAEMFAHRD